VSNILWLDECTPECAELVGGKALGLGHLLRQGLQVPPGFAVSTVAYRDFVEGAGLGKEIARALEGAEGPDAERQASERIRALFRSFEPGQTILDEVRSAYTELGNGQPAPVAVRSSATAEDTPEASFAGQQDTYLWIVGPEEVERHVVECWASLFTPQAIAYREHLGIRHDDVAIGVVVQMMVPAEVAGVMITLDPITGDRSQISIEASYGLGLAVVGGEVTPDRFAVDKVTLELRSRTIVSKDIAYRFDPDVGQVRVTEVPDEERGAPCLHDDEVVALAGIGKRVERALGCPQDIEWALGSGPAGGREPFLLQTRPETVWSRRSAEPIASPDEPILSRMLKNIRIPMRLKDAPETAGDPASGGGR
jgi:phosphoenolpyruvate synthase/pyruvate phosphate dikinase